MSNPLSDTDPAAAGRDDDSLNRLAVFDRLEVGPLQLEGYRLAAPYRLVHGGKVEQTELIYTYEEKVFDAASPASLNLAGMIAAQVAINYGLFCREIILHGPFDKADRRFLREMAKNTAREIFVKKFLEPNPFLIGNAVGLPAVKTKRYLRAELIFPEAADSAPVPAAWKTEPQRHCILSSGGKDSLLSFGLLDELGRDVHPMFVNESGRHWFTALNAYRHFRDHIPNTARVWVNADRVFSWMLRRMPFIRKDFAGVRSDEYPIRLWTVAVFLFGVLPLMHKRRIGRLVVGDEFDTSRKGRTRDIRHYDGLYDQSIWFDEALSRYFRRKGWMIHCLSILRPLSELLIQKILAERYPHLQEHQTSCHAAHKKADRIRPCGKCEKCRRIVGMLVALQADPARCGYTEEQVKKCLETLLEKGVPAQTPADSGQLISMLSQRKSVQVPGAVATSARPHPEILQLRFHPEVSPITAIPADLRADLYRIYLQHASGAVQRRAKTWQPLDLFSHPDLGRPDATKPQSATPGAAEAAAPATYFWGELCWPDAARRLDVVDTALLPVGSIEQHGPHLPLDTDAFDAGHLAARIAAGCSDPKPLVLPLVAYGVSYNHEAFKGTISINNDTLANLVYDIGISVAKNGIRKLVIINGHGGNSPSLHFAAQRINQDARIFVCVDSGETSDVDLEALAETPNDVHAGELETSTSLAARPQLVRLDNLQKEVPAFTSRYLDFTSKRGITWYAHTHKISNSGVLGDPTRASVEKGAKIWDIMIAHLVRFVDQLKAMTLEEIYQKKY